MTARAMGMGKEIIYSCYRLTVNYYLERAKVWGGNREGIGIFPETLPGQHSNPQSLIKYSTFGQNLIHMRQSLP